MEGNGLDDGWTAMQKTRWLESHVGLLSPRVGWRATSKTVGYDKNIGLRWSQIEFSIEFSIEF